MVDGSQGMVAFLGVPADTRLLDEDLGNLPDAEQHRDPVVSTHEHDRLVAAGSVLTGVTLIGGAAMLLYGGWQLLFDGGGALDAVLAVIGLLLAATHWGWVHVAEYVGLTIDERQRRSSDERRQEWLASDSAVPAVQRLHQRARRRLDACRACPAPAGPNRRRRPFTFVRETDAEEIYDAHTSAEVIATAVETMRRQARLETDRLRELWEAASTAYAAALLSAQDDQQQLAAQRAAATALSEHINASLLEPPLVE